MTPFFLEPAKNKNCSARVKRTECNDSDFHARSLWATHRRPVSLHLCWPHHILVLSSILSNSSCACLTNVPTSRLRPILPLLDPPSLILPPYLPQFWYKMDDTPPSFLLVLALQMVLHVFASSSVAPIYPTSYHVTSSLCSNTCLGLVCLLHTCLGSGMEKAYAPTNILANCVSNQHSSADTTRSSETHKMAPMVRPIQTP